jgi:transposase-like protein
MARGGKAAVWRERLRRFSRSGLTVAQFCEDEGVSEPSFYQWRKRLQSSADEPHAEAQPAFQQVAVTPTRPTPPPSVSIQLRCGARIELPSDDVELVQAVVRELTRAESEPASPAGGGRC